jgi:putative DNA primase/helicase
MTTPFDSLGNERRWVAWRTEQRGGRGKPTKVLYSSPGLRAKADDPTTWVTRAEAEATAAKIVNGRGGGIGCELGDVGDGKYLAGIDLDTCVDENGALAPWGAAILAAVPSYAETSPSGQGLKAFFYCAAVDVRPFLDRICVDAEAWGTRRSVGDNSANHGPAVEVYFALRYFAVTGNLWPSQPDRLTFLDRPALDQLAALIPLSRSATAGGGGGDNSRSAKAFGKGKDYRRQHPAGTFEGMAAILRSDSEIADWVREKGEPTGNVNCGESGIAPRPTIPYNPVPSRLSASSAVPCRQMSTTPSNTSPRPTPAFTNGATSSFDRHQC